MVRRVTARITSVEKTSLRQCIRPLMEPRAPGQDEFRCVSVLTSRSVVRTIIGIRFQTRCFDCSFVLAVPVQTPRKIDCSEAWSALDRCSQTVPKPLDAVSITLWHPCECGPSPSLCSKISSERDYVTTAAITPGQAPGFMSAQAILHWERSYSDLGSGIPNCPRLAVILK